MQKSMKTLKMSDDENTEEACKSCKFWLKINDDPDCTTGACCRMAPPARVCNVEEDENVSYEPRWALVNAAQWCGEWERSEKQRIYYREESSYGR